MFILGENIPRRERSARVSRYAAAAVLFVLITAAAELGAQMHSTPWLHAALLGVAAGGALLLGGRLREREARLERGRAELTAVLHSTDNGICLVDRESRVVFANAAMERLWAELDLPTEGTVWDRLVPLAQRTERPERLLGAFARLAEDPRLELEEEAEIVNVGRSFAGRTVPVVDRSGGLVGRVFTLRETTAERRAERFKDDLVATVSHELRTPLTSSLGFLDVLLDEQAGPLNAEQRQFLEIARRSSQRLVRLVGDLLFTATLDAGNLKIERGTVRLDAVAASCVADLYGTAEQRGVDLVLDDRPVPAFRGDPDRLRQLADNLLTNALKFTPAGGRVVVSTRVDDGQAVLEVRDSGIGIPEEEIELLFERFFRASTATERELPGTGLGLRICKAIVEGHGGTIGVESEEGRGTTFRVELPMVAAPMEAHARVA